MNWYLEVLKKYAVFTGRARRREYWYFFLSNTIIVAALFFVDLLMGTTYVDADVDVTVGLLSGIYMLLVLIPILAVSVRRLHDIGRSGWMLLIALIPFGEFAIYIMAMLDSESGENRFGPNPKGVVAD
ncbi:MAG: DUF805 domain-containing protein [Gammaproteobacteria bacterium]|nr:DUF805 domain-containing protein [Gammaproteobacteria bacterium]NNJ85165.1 DUF805 domain-containing protein [Gammaproteobacteria bacterium]